MIFKWIDRILRNPLASWEQSEGAVEFLKEIGRILAVIIFTSASFGVGLGFYVGGRHILDLAWKMPFLMLSTFSICAAGMYIVNALAARKLSFPQVMLMGLSSISITSIVAGAFAPIMFIFAISLRRSQVVDYGFLVMLCTAVIATGGTTSVFRLYGAFKKLDYARGTRIFILSTWLFIYQFVGAQMVWVLRPFIGSFTGVDDFQGNFYESIPRLINNIIIHLTGGG